MRVAQTRQSVLHHNGRVLSGLLATSLLLVATPALAGVTTFEFSGTVTFVSGSPMGINTSVDAPLSGTVVWDTSLPPAFDTGSVAGYNQPLPSGITVEISGTNLQSDGTASFQVTNNYFGSDGVNGFFSSVLANSQPASGSISFLLSDSSASVFSDTSLPEDLSETDFNLRVGSLSDGAGFVSFSIDTIGLSAIAVGVDMRPEGIVPERAGLIPVLVLTTDGASEFGAFDAATVDPATVRFGLNGDEAAPVKHQVTPHGLLLFFEADATGFVCGSASGTVTGSTFDGQAFEGSDSFETVGCS